jgi:hypothetical protein
VPGEQSEIDGAVRPAGPQALFAELPPIFGLSTGAVDFFAVAAANAAS